MRFLSFSVLILVLITGGYFAYKHFITPSISEINARSVELDGLQVSIQGVVSKNIGVLGMGGFIVTDGTSEILILTNNGLPENGSEIEVTGTFRKAVSFNSFEYNVIYLN